MKNVLKCCLVQIGFFLFLYGKLILAEPLLVDSSAEVSISLQEKNFEHIKFKRIKENNYVFNNHQLKVEVDNSASFLMMPFDQIQKISQVSFQWRSIDKPDIKNAAHEEKRNGDDAVFKVALLLKADDVLFNPLMPAWMKRVGELLPLPSKEMIYLVADAKHAEGQSWVNPYNDRVKMIAMGNSVDANGWMKANYTFDQPVEAVGIWLMSDGDNTHSKFTAKVKNIVLK